MNSPEHNPDSNQTKRLQQFAFFVRELATERDASLETEHTGFRLSVKDGFSMYIHTGSDDLSTVQKLDFMRPDTFVDISFSAHNTSGEIPDGIKGKIYRIGEFGVRVARRGEAQSEVPTENELSEQASDTEKLHLVTAISRTIFRKR